MQVFEGKAFLLIFLFSFEKIVLKYFSVLLPLFTESATKMSIFHMILNGYSFLINSVLFFIVLYYFCGKILPEKPASTIISLFVGAFVGTLVGGLTTSFLLTAIEPKNFSFISGLSLLLGEMQYGIVSTVSFALVAICSAWLVTRWDEMLFQAGFERSMDKPFEIVFVSILYIIFGILALCLLPLIPIMSYVSTDLSIIVSIIPLFLIDALGQLAIGFGIYNGKRWGWLAAFIGALIGIGFNIHTLTIYSLSFPLTNFLNLTFLITAIAALILNLLVLAFLLSSNSRHYCRIINPHTYHK